MGQIKEYRGLIICVVSACIALQLSWVIEHQRPDETLQRAATAALIGIIVSVLLVQGVFRFCSGPVQSALRTISGALWPGFLLLFMPFHVLLYCRWQGQCDYAWDAFIIQFSVFFLLILFAGPLRTATGGLRNVLGGITAGRLARVFTGHGYLAAVCLALALLLWRGWERFVHPEFFAEGVRITSSSRPVLFSVSAICAGLRRTKAGCMSARP